MKIWFCSLSLLVFLCFFPPFLESQQEKIVKKCMQCNYIEEEASAKFCIHCGQPLIKIVVQPVLMCMKCNKPIAKGGKFCMYCGEKGQIVYQVVDTAQKNTKKEDTQKKEETEPTIKLLPPVAEETEPVAKDFEKKSEEKSDVIPYPGAISFQKYDAYETEKHTAQQRRIRRELFLCSASMDDVEKFYKSQYPSISVIRDFSYNAVHLLKLKVALPNKQIQITHYMVCHSKSPEVWNATCTRIHWEAQKKLKPIQRMEEKLKELQKKVQEQKAGPTTEKEIAKLQEEYILATNTSSYWDTIALEKTVSMKKSILLITVIIPTK